MVGLIADRRGETRGSGEHHRNHQRSRVDPQFLPQRDRNGRDDDGDRIVGDNLGHDHRQDIDCEHQRPWRNIAQERRQMFDQQVDASGLLQAEADGEHAEDQYQHIAIDRAPGFFRVNTARQQNGTHGQYGGDGQW